MIRNPYGIVKNFGEFIIVCKPDSKIPIQNFNSWKNLNTWVNVNNLEVLGNHIYRK